MFLKCLLCYQFVFRVFLVVFRFSLHFFFHPSIFMYFLCFSRPVSWVNVNVTVIVYFIDCSFVVCRIMMFSSRICRLRIVFSSFYFVNGSFLFAIIIIIITL